MILSYRFSFTTRTTAACLALALMFASLSAPAHAQVTAFKQAVSEAAASDRDIAAFYKANGYDAIWTDPAANDRKRLRHLMAALEKAGDHGLPAGRYNTAKLMDQTDRHPGAAQDRQCDCPFHSIPRPHVLSYQPVSVGAAGLL